MTETVSIGPLEKPTKVVGALADPKILSAGDTLTVQMKGEGPFRITYHPDTGYLFEVLE